MRFLADGPWLPDELLTARDEGRVLFFCGAGVSRANACLPDFFGLARSVLGKLRALPDSPANKLVDMWENQTPITGVGKMVAADRVFGLLEREFSIAHIERAVGDALRPKHGVDLRAHRVLLALSRDTAGKIRLVTTNFDLLFEAAAPKVPVWTPARLPQFRDIEGFEGIVHLHGMFDAVYERPIGGSLVLSSAEFGRAYLAEGWATNFIRGVIRNYRIVFVGYQADDPPVQYLLEALSRTADSPSSGLYAFQSGRPEEARALWAQKGVTAIAYDPSNRHAALWETLTAWAERAVNPERWRQRLLRRALSGPKALQPHERGQVVHLAMTEDGARSIAQAKSALPASWTCAFDPGIRYAPPALANFLKKDSSCVDPFADYGLDSDPKPTADRSKNLHQRPEIPDDAIDVVVHASADQRPTVGRFRGYDSLHVTELPPRLVSLAWWFHRICHEPAAIWWAAGQEGLHPKVVELIAFALDQRTQTLAPEVRSAWRYLFEGLKTPRQPDYGSAIALNTAVEVDGWTTQHLRRFAEILARTAKRGTAFLARPLSHKSEGAAAPRTCGPGRALSRAARADLYPGRSALERSPLLRRNLEFAIDLEREVSPFSVPQIASIDPDPALAGMSSGRDAGINGAVFKFVELFKRHVAQDPAGARSELEAWRRNDDPVFGRLRVWASRTPEFPGRQNGV